MIPIRDEIKTRRVPLLNYLLIIVNALVFVYIFMQQANTEALYYEYSLIPAQVTSGLDPGDLKDIFTSMFMHGGWMHLIGNMIYLWIFGDNIEDRLGHLGYLIFYLAGGIIAAFAHILSSPNSLIPTVGASGAVAAVLGAYLVFYPNSRVYTFIPLGFFFRLRLLPAGVVLVLWFILQLFSGVGSIGLGDMGGVAYWAHIGGFVFGVLIGWIFKSKKMHVPAPPSWS